MSSNRQLRTGGDPRLLADYGILREEISKLTHPARPDVDWKKVERLCLSLFQQNGVELQTASWYTQARTYLVGLSGLDEGLAIIEALISHKWVILWPLQVNARMDILNGLSQRLKLTFRSLTLEHHDLQQIYQVEKRVDALCDVLQRLELKHASQLEDISVYMHNAAMRLENMSAHSAIPMVLQSVAEKGEKHDNSRPWVYATQADTTKPNVIISPAPQKKSRLPWKGFLTGLIFTVIVGLGGIASIHGILHSPAKKQLVDSLAVLPKILTAQDLKIMKIRNLAMIEAKRSYFIDQTEERIKELANLSPRWSQNTGARLVYQAQTLWPDEPKTASLEKDWTQQRKANATPVENLQGWHSANLQLQKLADKLNGLDERRGHYVTVSELKTAVFAIQQALSNATPVEESLRKLAADRNANKEIPPQRLTQLDNHFMQLLNRYALLSDGVDEKD